MLQYCHINLSFGDVQLGLMRLICMPPEKCMALSFTVVDLLDVCVHFFWGGGVRTCAVNRTSTTALIRMQVTLENGMRHVCAGHHFLPLTSR